MTLHIKIELPFKGFDNIIEGTQEYRDVLDFLRNNLTYYVAWYPMPTQIPVANGLVFNRTEDGRMVKTISKVYPSIEIELSTNGDANLNEEYRKFRDIILKLYDKIP